MNKQYINQLVRAKTRPQPNDAKIDGSSEQGGKGQDPVQRRMGQIDNVLAQLIDQPLYMLEMQVVVGPKQSTKFAAADLGLNADVISKLDEIQARGGYAPKFSQTLKKAANQLRGAAKKLYRECTIYSTPFRFVRGEHLEQALDLIAEIEAEAETLRADLVQEYPDQMRDFLDKVESVLTTAFPNQPDRVKLALERYAEEYPSPEDFEQALQVVVKGPTKLSGITDQLKEDAELQKQLAQQDLEAAEARAAEQALQTQQRSQELIARNLGQALDQVKDNCTNEAFGLAGEAYDRLTAKTPADFNQRDNDALQSLKNRLQLLASHCDSLKPMADWISALHDLYAEPSPPADHYDRVATEVYKFRQFLMTQVQNTDAPGQGIKALVRSLEFNNEFTELKAELEYLEQHPDAKALVELEAKCTSTLDQLKFRQNILAKLFKQAKQKADKAPTSSQPTQPGHAFDPDAGF